MREIPCKRNFADAFLSNTAHYPKEDWCEYEVTKRLFGTENPTCKYDLEPLAKPQSCFDATISSLQSESVSIFDDLLMTAQTLRPSSAVADKLDVAMPEL